MMSCISQEVKQQTKCDSNKQKPSVKHEVIGIETDHFQIVTLVCERGQKVILTRYLLLTLF